MNTESRDLLRGRGTYVDKMRSPLGLEERVEGILLGKRTRSLQREQSLYGVCVQTVQHSAQLEVQSRQGMTPDQWAGAECGCLIHTKGLSRCQLSAPCRWRPVSRDSKDAILPGGAGARQETWTSSRAVFVMGKENSVCLFFSLWY